MMNSSSQHREVDLGLLPITTLVIWMGCLVVGVMGLLIPYPWPRAPAKEPTPVQAEVMHVELTKQVMPSPDIGAPSPPAADSALPQPPAPPEAIVAPSAPPLIAVAEPTPAIAFPLPVEGSSQQVDAKQASPASPAPIAPQQPVAQRLTYGQGEGRQPAPEYPREAALARQQGTVVVRFTVGEDGRVQTVQAISPCPFPLLNQAAVRAVRETWRFRAGLVRSYEVSIEFQLKQR